MIALGDSDFEALCADGPVRARIEALEGERAIAARAFWLRGLGGIALACAVGGLLFHSGWRGTGGIAFLVLLVVAIIAAIGPVLAAKEGLKHPVLAAIAARAGMDYIPAGFSPPAFAVACRSLFGGRDFSSEVFTDLFNGTDAESRGCAVYEACLQRRAGRNSYSVFSGQIYAIQRQQAGQGVYTAILPDRKILNLLKPAADMARVPIEGDAAFEKKFEVYSTHAEEARRLLADADFRARLLALRAKGKVYVFAGPEEALLAANGADRFEPGNMLRARPGEARVRLMFDDVRESLALLEELKVRLG
jgi:hypothetical protein